MKTLIWKTAAAISIGWIATSATAQQPNPRPIAPPFQNTPAPVATPADFVGYRYGYVGVPASYRANAKPAGETYVGYLAEEPPANSGDGAMAIDDPGAKTVGGCNSCGSAACCGTCCEPFWAHRTGAFLDF
ncbi:MAG TPA: hypothetical protein VHB99_14010, partial [Pirellulales bacterium]|nr:hypothetical protein [Pirellulales bacterium]